MFEKLLQYQRLDGKILALERDIQKNESKQLLNRLGVAIRDEQNKLIELESKSKQLISQFEKNNAEYTVNYKEMAELAKKDVTKMSETDAEAILDKINKVVMSLSNLERSLSSGQEAIGSILKAFEACKNNIVSYKARYKQVKEQFDKFLESMNPQIEGVRLEMTKLEKELDSTMLSKYKHLRQDRIFPVFVPLNNNACGGCSMELPAALINKLTSKGYLECEQCRRYIYIN